MFSALVIIQWEMSPETVADIVRYMKKISVFLTPVIARAFVTNRPCTLIKMSAPHSQIYQTKSESKGQTFDLSLSLTFICHVLSPLPHQVRTVECLAINNILKE